MFERNFEKEIERRAIEIRKRLDSYGTGVEADMALVGYMPPEALAALSLAYEKQVAEKKKTPVASRFLDPTLLG